MKWLFLSLLLAGCAGQYQNLSSLRNELDSAKEKLNTAHERVIRLEEEIAQKEIARIQSEIATLQDSQDNALTKEERLIFFAKQREVLAQIIKNKLSCATEAQLVLNKILTYITEMSDTVVE